ncbi:MAG: hypothetical protein PHR24_05095 [Oscillospiraceae bacterium]|nr:hypothetical protein [Oscillospiraceae bacterium]
MLVEYSILINTTRNTLRTLIPMLAQGRLRATSPPYNTHID